MKKKRMIAVVMLLFALMITGTGMTTLSVYGAEARGEETNLAIRYDMFRSIQAAAGSTVHVTLDLYLKEGYSCVNPEFVITGGEGSPLSFKNIKTYNRVYQDYGYSNDFVIISERYDFGTDVDYNDYLTLEFDIVVDDYAAIGHYDYYITYKIPEHEYVDGKLPDGMLEPGKLSMRLSVVSEKIPPQIAVVGENEYYANAGDTVYLTFTLQNQGELKALDTYVQVDYLTAYDKILIPAYTPINQKIGSLTSGEEKIVSVSYKVAEDTPTGVYKLPVIVNCKTENGETISAINNFLYLYIEGAAQVPTPTPTPEPTPTPVPMGMLLLNNVKQSSSTPKAGNKLKVTFYLENVGDGDINNVKVSLPDVSSAGFEPVNSEPYQYIGTIAAGTKKKIELNVKLGENIPEGVNTLYVQYTYDGGSERVPLYILNVKNSKDEEVVISRPKLMISNFYTEPEEVKAGNTFDFTFDIFNTNDSIDAKNIKVTVSGASNVFSVTAGGNSFFVNQIKAQETAPITINLKASAAATTGAYPINIKIEYEYEGIKVTETYSGEVVQEEILLQVKENLRPSVENIYVGSWDTPIVNQPTAMNFEFYNMGKSTLNNTYITIEGDFMLSNGSNSYFVGNIAPGMPEYIEFDVVPLIEGNATGKMVIHMEDSNGDEVTMEKEFTAYISGEMMWEDPGYMDPGMMDPGFSDPSMPVDGPVAEPIVNLWVFLGIQAGILVVGIVAARAIRLSVYRKKIKEEDAV